MDLRALYENALRQMEADAVKCYETGKRLVLGYTSDLDVVLEWNGEAFARIADEFLREEPRYAPGDVIDSMEAFAGSRDALSGRRRGRRDRHHKTACRGTNL
jgi:hypothetical protein